MISLARYVCLFLHYFSVLVVYFMYNLSIFYGGGGGGEVTKYHSGGFILLNFFSALVYHSYCKGESTLYLYGCMVATSIKPSFLHALLLMINMKIGYFFMI